jgi:hypothetical protein
MTYLISKGLKHCKKAHITAGVLVVNICIFLN